MSALMTSMCVYRNIRHITGVLGCQRTFPLHDRTQKPCLNFSNSLPPGCLLLTAQMHVCRYSSQSSGANNTDATRLTQTILAGKIAEQQKEAEDKAGGSNKKEDSKEEDKNTWKHFFIKHGYKFLLGSILTSSVCLVIEWGSPLKDAEGNTVEDEFSELNIIEGYIRRTYKELFHQVKVTREPSREKLLPEPLSYPYIQPKYTVVLEMTDVLVHPEWTYETGWRFKKRPGIDHFLKAIGPPTFEVVVYTKELGMTADPIITKIDPENYIMYRLYRDATRYEDGVHIKDLNCLNRDLSKVIFIDWNKQACKLSQDNMFALKRWRGEDNDTVLGELASFIQAIAQSNVDDVRPVLKYYNTFEEPLRKFEENRRLQLEEQERQKQMIKQKEEQNLAKKIRSRLF